MEKIQDSTSEVSLNLEIQSLRERETQWRQEREHFLQKEKWWQHQWQQREMLFQAKELQLMQNQSQALTESLKNCDTWKCKYENLSQDFESYREESKERETVLVKLLQSERHHLIVEIPKHSFEDEELQNTKEANLKGPIYESKVTQTNEEVKPNQPCFESKTTQTIGEATLKQPSFETKASQANEQPNLHQSSNTDISDDNDQVVYTFGDFPEELQFWKDSSVEAVEMITPETRTTKIRDEKSTQQAVEDAVQAKDKWFAVKWEEREKAWERQWSEAKSDHNSMCNILKSLYEHRIQELETAAATESKRREEHLSKILEVYSAKPVASDAPRTEDSLNENIIQKS